MEPFYDQYKDTLDELNKCAKSFDGTVVGNLFYMQNGNKISDMMLEKRMDFCDFALNSDCIVEIGFNAGHSALLGLTANRDLIYYSIEIGQPYSEACFDILKNRFGDRIFLTVGDSLDCVPIIKEIYPEIDSMKIGWFIDGNHTSEYFKKDLDNVLALAKHGELIYLDDTNQIRIIDVLKEYFSNNIITKVKRGKRSTIVTKVV